MNGTESEALPQQAPQKRDDKEFLGKAPIGKLLLKLALPTVVAQLINMLYNIVDRIYIGHMPKDGQIALTGLGVCLPLILLVSAFAALIANGGAPARPFIWAKAIMRPRKKRWATVLLRKSSFPSCSRRSF